MELIPGQNEKGYRKAFLGQREYAKVKCLYGSETRSRPQTEPRSAALEKSAEAGQE